MKIILLVLLLTACGPNPVEPSPEVVCTIEGLTSIEEILWCVELNRRAAEHD